MSRGAPWAGLHEHSCFCLPLSPTVLSVAQAPACFAVSPAFLVFLLFARLKSGMLFQSACQEQNAAGSGFLYEQTQANSENKDSLRTKREMHTLAVILDHLAVGKYREAADTAGQRMKALDLAARTGSRMTASQVELVPQDTPV